MELAILLTFLSPFVLIPLYVVPNYGPFGQLVRVGRQLGLKYRRLLFRLEGQYEGVAVSLRSSTRDATRANEITTKSQSVKLEVRVPCASGFTVRTEGVLDGLRAADPVTGDSEVDSVLWFVGDPIRVAALDVRARRWLVTRIGNGAWMDNGFLAVNDPFKIMSERELTARLRTAIECADALAPSRADIPGRLAHNATADPNPGVRLRCLGMLLREYGDFQETVAVLADIRAGNDMACRLVAAASEGDSEELGRLAPHVMNLPSPTLEQLCWALTQIETCPALGPVLLTLWTPHDEDRAAAISPALGHHGTIDTVTMLRAEASGQPRRVTAAIESAIARIQGRYAGAEAGQVSLVDDSGAGAVSLAEVPAEDELTSA